MLFTVLFTFIIRLSVATMTIVSSSWGDGSGHESHGGCGGDLVMPRSILARTCVCVCKAWRQLQKTWRCLLWPAWAAPLHIMSCWLYMSWCPCGLRLSSHTCPVLCFKFPTARTDCKCLEGGLKLSLKLFFGTPREHFSSTTDSLRNCYLVSYILHNCYVCKRWQMTGNIIR